MRKTSLALILAVLFGFLAMIIPLAVWYQLRFADEPLTLNNLREKAMNSPQPSGQSLDGWDQWNRWSISDSTSTFPICITFAVSLVVSVSVYLLSKKRFLKMLHK